MTTRFVDPFTRSPYDDSACAPDSSVSLALELKASDSSMRAAMPASAGIVERTTSPTGIGGTGARDQPMIGWLAGLPNAEQLFVQLLAGTQPRIDDADRDGRLTSETVCHVVDPHGLAHVEDEDVPVATDGACLDHELDRLLDGHEESSHVRIRHRDRATGLDLGPERRNHRASTSENVAESDAEIVVGPNWLRELRSEPLCDALGVAKDTLRIRRLVRRDVDEGRDAVAPSRVEDVQRSEHIGLERLRRPHLQ